MTNNEHYRAGMVAGVSLVTRVMASYKPSQHLDCDPLVCAACGTMRLLIDAMEADKEDLAATVLERENDDKATVDAVIGWLDNGQQIRE